MSDTASSAMHEFLKRNSQSDGAEGNAESTVRNLYGQSTAPAAAAARHEPEAVEVPRSTPREVPRDDAAPAVPLVAEDALLDTRTASAPDESAGKRPPKRALAIVALVIVVVAVMSFGPDRDDQDKMLAGSSEEGKGPAATDAAPAALPQWNSVRSDSDLPPLNQTGDTSGGAAPEPEASVTSSNLEKQILSGQVPPAAVASAPLQAPPASSQLAELNRSIEAMTAQLQEQGGNIQTIISRLDALEADVQKLKTAKRPSATSRVVTKASQEPSRPDINVSAITRTAHCSVCQPYALIETQGRREQLGNGDTVLGYRVSIGDDRVILSSGKTQFSYFPNSR